MRRRTLLKMCLAGSAMMLAGCGTPRGAAFVDGRLTMAVISTYGTGTATYADMAAVANAVTNNTGLRTRIMTSDTAIGRLTPLQSGLATFSRTGDEYIFAFEADYDFTTPEWGPQPTRVVWAPTAPHGLMVRADSGIERVGDLHGRRIPLITANPSVNTKIGVALQAAGLTENDVEMVPISYGEQASGLQAGRIDMLFQQVYGSSLYELESAVAVSWIDLMADEEALMTAIRELSPSLMLGPFAGAPGQSEGQEDSGFVYAIPIITYAETDEDTVTQFLDAILDSYDDYKEATRTAEDWSIDAAVTSPQQVPFHPGLVQVLTERGHWTSESQAQQDALLQREQELQRGWTEVTTSDPDDLTAAWSAWKDQNVD